MPEGLESEGSLEEILKRLKEDPLTTAQANDSILAPIYAYLVGESDERAELHWFCDKTPAQHTKHSGSRLQKTRSELDRKATPG